MFYHITPSLICTLCLHNLWTYEEYYNLNDIISANISKHNDWVTHMVIAKVIYSYYYISQGTIMSYSAGYKGSSLLYKVQI